MSTLSVFTEGTSLVPPPLHEKTNLTSLLNLCYTISNYPDINYQLSTPKQALEKKINALDFFNVRVEQFSDRSIRWLFKDPEYVRGLLEIVNDPLVEELDFSRLTQENTTFIPDNLREQEADIVCSVPYRRSEDAGETDETDETEDLLLYILIEHQSTVDASMGFRLLFYMMHIWDTQRRDWESEEVPMSQWRLRPIVPIVVYTGDRPWHPPLSLTALMGYIPASVAEAVPSFTPLFLNVKETEVSDLTRNDHPFGWLLTVLQKERAPKEELRAALSRAVREMSRLDGVDRRQWGIFITYLCLLISHRRPSEEREELRSLISDETQGSRYEEEAKEVVQTIADYLREEGREEGIAQGVQLGREEGIAQGVQLGREEGIAQGVQLGREEGVRESVIEGILENLEIRFEDSDLERVVSQLTPIQDITRLKQLRREALRTRSVAAFQEAVAANGANGTD